MGAEKIDHKAEALDHLTAASKTTSGEIKDHRIALAGVHATLYAAEQAAALVEQQRITNLIAYTSELADNQREGYELSSSGEALIDSIEAQILQGLGLA